LCLDYQSLDGLILQIARSFDVICGAGVLNQVIITYHVGSIAHVHAGDGTTVSAVTILVIQTCDRFHVGHLVYAGKT